MGKYLSLSLTASQSRARQRYFPTLRSGFGSSRARYRKADKKFACRPFGAARFVWGGLGCGRLVDGLVTWLAGFALGWGGAVV